MERESTSPQVVKTPVPGERLGRTITIVIVALMVAAFVSMFLSFPEISPPPDSMPSTFWLRTTYILFALLAVVLGLCGAIMLIRPALARPRPGREQTYVTKFPRLSSISLVWLGVFAAFYAVYLAVSPDPLNFDPLSALFTSSHDPRAVPWLFLAVAVGPLVAVMIAARFPPSRRAGAHNVASGAGD